MSNVSLTDRRIGFLGLGLMGKPMCLNLYRAGAQMRIWNRTRQVAEALRQPGMTVEQSPAAVAAGADVLILMLADTPAVEQVLFAAGGVAEAIRAGSTVVDMGTTEAGATRVFAERLQALGASYVDAPVSGGEIGAIDATLVIMAGGSDTALAAVRDVLTVLGRQLTHIGGVGAGQVAKAANQLIVGLNIGAVAEALSLAQRAGVDPARVREALLGGFAASRVLEVHGQRMIDGNFAPGARMTTQYKDLDQACRLGDEVGQQLPATALCRSLYRQAIERGDADLDHSALIRLLQADSA